MALASLFDDFPVFRYYNESLRRNRLTRPRLYSVLDSLEDEIGHKVGEVFRILSRLTMELDEYENSEVGKKRKLRSGAVSTYEPKSKVVVSDKDDKFKIILDTSNYQPEEITVKVVNDKLAISAKHEAKEKDVYEFSEMYRSFDLPENIDPNTITAYLSSTGQLTIEAPLKALLQSNEGTISIQKPLEDSTERPLEDSFERQFEERIERRFEERFEKRFEERIERRLEERIGRRLEERIGRRLEERIGRRLEERIGRRLEERIGRRLEERIERSIVERVLRSIVERVLRSIEERVERSVKERIERLMEEPVESKKKPNVEDPNQRQL